jgi:outer membrane receptor protein involved in Fe transport
LRYQQDRQQRSGTFGAAQQEVALDYDRTFDAWLPKLSLAFDFSKAVRVGILAQRAYNPGGTTLRFDVGKADDFEAERLWDYEFFVRAQLPAGLSMSANLFYYDMHDAQRLKSILVPAPGGSVVGFADLFNARKAHSYGAEGEIAWRHGDRLLARFSGGLLRTELVDAGAEYAAFEGNEFGRAPHFSAAAAVDWRASRRIRLSAQGRYHGDYFSDDVNSPEVHVPAALIVDARTEYRIGKVTAFAYVRNMFDKFALLDRVGNLVASVEDPRRVGVGIEAGF